jgi:ABC-2 type transport system ATP-binding protein
VTFAIASETDVTAIEVSQLRYSYGGVDALRKLTFSVPDGALYALLGPNGSGKTTLLQILMGLRRNYGGRAALLGVESRALGAGDRGHIGYVAEGQSLPRWMTLEQLEAYLAPLYSTWDAQLARDLRNRFDLDPKRRMRTLSRGEHMKAALLCALAPRPRLILMDEPFTGMDALVKDELVRGLLESAGSDGWTVLLCSHDIGELELLADWVGFLDHGQMTLSEPMETLRQRFKHVDVVQESVVPDLAISDEWMSVEGAGKRLSFLLPNADDERLVALSAQFGGAQVDVRDATLREVFVALAKRGFTGNRQEVTA